MDTARRDGVEYASAEAKLRVPLLDHESVAHFEAVADVEKSVCHVNTWSVH